MSDLKAIRTNNLRTLLLQIMGKHSATLLDNGESLSDRAKTLVVCRCGETMVMANMQVHLANKILENETMAAQLK